MESLSPTAYVILGLVRHVVELRLIGELEAHGLAGVDLLGPTRP